VEYSLVGHNILAEKMAVKGTEFFGFDYEEVDI